MKRAILAVTIMLTFTGPGNATSFLNGENLHEMCERYPEWTAGYVPIGASCGGSSLVMDAIYLCSGSTAVSLLQEIHHL